MSPFASPQGGRPGFGGFSSPSFEGARGSFGISPSSFQGLELWLDATKETAYSDGDDVTTPTDWSGNATGFTQATAADKPHWRSAANGINGHAAFEFDGANQFWSTASMSVASGGKTLYAVVESDVNTGAHYLFDSQTGRLVMGVYNNNYAFYAPTWQDSGDQLTTTAQVLSYVLSAGTGTAYIYRNGTSLGALNYTNVAIGGNTYISRDSPTDAAWWDGQIGEIFVYSSAHSSAVRTKLERYLGRRWGIAVA